MFFDSRLVLKQWLYKKPVVWPLLETLQGVLYSFNYFYYYGLLKGKQGSSIREVNIEFNSQCNLRCQFCSLDHDKPKHRISSEILEKFLKGFIEDKRYRKIKRINLYNGGEVLLHPDRIEMLSVISKYRGIAAMNNIMFPEVHLLTNAMLLREKLSRELIELDIVDRVGVSFDGGTPELFEDMRTNAKWDIFYDNIKTFDRLRKEMGSDVKLTAISCIPFDRPRNIKWMHPQFKEIYALLDHYELRRLHNWAGDIEEIKTPKKKHKIGCTLLMEQMVLLPNGDITICCNDINSKAVIGNILETDFMDIYGGDKRKELLNLHLRGKKEQIPFCANCETF